MLFYSAGHSESRLLLGFGNSLALPTSACIKSCMEVIPLKGEIMSAQQAKGRLNSEIFTPTRIWKLFGYSKLWGKYLSLSARRRVYTKNKKKPPCAKAHGGFLEATPRFELGIRVLQTHALPLGYVAEFVSLV